MFLNIKFPPQFITLKNLLIIKMSAREKCKPVEGKTVYDRLTNPAGYTG